MPPAPTETPTPRQIEELRQAAKTLSNAVQPARLLLYTLLGQPLGRNNLAANIPYKDRNAHGANVDCAKPLVASYELLLGVLNMSDALERDPSTIDLNSDIYRAIATIDRDGKERLMKDLRGNIGALKPQALQTGRSYNSSAEFDAVQLIDKALENVAIFSFKQRDVLAGLTKESEIHKGRV